MPFLDRLAGLVSPAAGLRRALMLFDSGKSNDAFPLMAAAARAGIVEAQYRVARCYLEGLGVPASRMEGARWLLQAANHGSADAQALLAALYVAGLMPAAAGSGFASDRLFEQETTSAPDFEAAFGFAAKAAEAGSAEGQAILGYILTNGPEELHDLDAAHRWYELSAAAGCAEGSLGLALSLARRGLASNRAEIERQLQHAVDGGLSSAVYLLAVLTENGPGESGDRQAAAGLYERAAEDGITAAQLRLGLALLDGTFGRRDEEAGEAWMRRAALAGNAEAAFLLGDRAVKGGSPNFAEAIAWFRQAVDGGHPGAARALASLYLTGNGVAKDVEEGTRLLRVAANSGHRDAQVDLANLFLKGADEVGDPASIARWFEAAASSGDRIAAFNLGMCFAKGVGVQQDEGQAAHWMRRAAEGIGEAQYMYARILLDGRGVPANAREARLWFGRAARSGVLDAQVALGEMLVNGRGGEASPEKALTVFRHAASKGHAGAMFALGLLHANGHGLPANPAAAQKWFMAAAKRGHGQAELMMGRYLSKGLGGEYDPAAGRIWLERAAAHGIDEAEEELAELALAQG
jgi:TPR repeat protein